MFILREFPIQKSLLIWVWSEVYSNQNLFPMCGSLSVWIWSGLHSRFWIIQSGFGRDLIPFHGVRTIAHQTIMVWGWSRFGLDLVPILGIITIIGGLDFTPDFGLFGQDLVWI